ncbi:MAG: hypothetical protein HFI14_04925 [Lachnospiraceae bacterium]|nr:hypothetical protein [Lachnospiraceae bacterium]
MNKCRKFFAGLLVSCMAFSLGGVSSQAAEPKEPYSYKITFYAGNQGTFADTSGIQVVDAQKKIVPAQIHTGADGSYIQIDGLKEGYFVTFGNIQGSAVSLGESSPYYVRGIRKSGYDNDELALGALSVKQDQDYVVAYGIKGEMVAYQVHFEDASGRRLADSRTYYGNIGDRPVVAFLYIDGYEPQAYNLTKTLSENEAENIFTFVYSRISGGGGGGGGTAAEDSAGVTEQPSEAGVPEQAVTEGGAAQAGGAADAAADAADAAEEPEAGVAVPDEPVPQEEGPEELLDLDDEEVPLADKIGGLEEGTANLLGAAAVSVTGAAALLVLVIFLLRRRKKAAAETEEE